MSEFEYSQVSADEMVEDEKSEVPRRRSLGSVMFLAFAGLLLFTAFTAFVVGISKIESVQPNSESFSSNSEWSHEHGHETRATGDKYLVGVGKADITG